MTGNRSKIQLILNYC